MRSDTDRSPSPKCSQRRLPLTPVIFAAFRHDWIFRRLVLLHCLVHVKLEARVGSPWPL